MIIKRIRTLTSTKGKNQFKRKESIGRKDMQNQHGRNPLKGFMKINYCKQYNDFRILKYCLRYHLL